MTDDLRTRVEKRWRGCSAASYGTARDKAFQLALDDIRDLLAALAAREVELEHQVEIQWEKSRLVVSLQADIEAAEQRLEIALGALADIGHADDLSKKALRAKARRIYEELRLVSGAR